MSQRARSSGPKGSTIPKGSKLPTVPKGPLQSFPKSQPVPSSNSSGSSDSSGSSNLKEMVDRIYDESERCFDKMRMIHGTTVPHGKMVIWEVKGTPRTPEGVRSEKRSPLFKIKVINGQRHGRYREYYPNGQRKFETYFQMNQETGPRHNWSDQGQEQVQVR